MHNNVDDNDDDSADYDGQNARFIHFETNQKSVLVHECDSM